MSLDDFFAFTPVAAAAKVHAKLSPSSSARWTICHAAPSRESGVRDDGNAAARWGTVAHDLGEMCLKAESYDPLEERLGLRATVAIDGTVTYAGQGEIEIDDEMESTVRVYVDFVQQMAMGGDLYIEQRLSISHITGEEGAKGTSDTVILYDDEICVIDLKGGYMRVFAKYLLEGVDFATAPESIRIKALFPADGPHYKPNTQLVMYADAARREHDPQGTRFRRVRIIIVQPRLNHIDEHVMPVEEFEQWVDWIADQAEATRSPDAKAVPGEKQCTFCKAFPCKEVDALVLSEALQDFDDLDNVKAAVPNTRDLGRRKTLVPLIRMYCDSIEARVRAELAAGRTVPGWKLVDGQMGDRKWQDDALVEAELFSMGLSESDYTTRKLLGPAGIEKLAVKKRATPKKRLTADQWAELERYITRDPGAPMVVPDSDPRPARTENAADVFDDD